MCLLIIMHVCRCAIGGQMLLIYWPGHWMFFVRVTGSVVGLAGFFVYALQTFSGNLSDYNMYISIVNVMLFYV